MPVKDAREAALRILLDYQKKDAYLNAVLASHLRSGDLDRRDRAFVTELVQGTVRMLATLDWILRPVSDRDLESLDLWILWILRVAAYQIFFTSVPDYAACDTAVELARRRAGASGASYVNGVLRSLLRGKQSIRFPDREEDPALYLEVRYSHQRWVVDMWLKELGFEKTESLCAANNTARPASIRCNLPRISRNELAGSLRECGFSTEISGLVPEGILLKGGGSLIDLEQYRLGEFSLQDQASILVGYAVDPGEGNRVLDMCSAPGGKANHIAELMGNRGRVLAVDINGARIRMVEEASKRLGNASVETMVGDSTEIGSLTDERFERVLIDAPCSGLGTLARKPDVRWRKVVGDIERLARLQILLLEEAAKMVVPGGTLIYSTCTISRRENDAQVDYFRERHPSFAPVDVSGLARGDVGGPTIQLFPDTDGCDGVFIAALQRKR